MFLEVLFIQIGSTFVILMSLCISIFKSSFVYVSGSPTNDEMSLQQERLTIVKLGFKISKETETVQQLGCCFPFFSILFSLP
jgi:hypothetical protein